MSLLLLFPSSGGGGGGTTFTKALAGSLAPSAVARKASKGELRASSLSPTGALAAQIKLALLVSGSVTLSSTLRDKLSRKLTGSLTALGGLRKRTALRKLGSMLLTSAVRRKVAKRPSGSLSPTGALSDAVSTRKAVSGTTTLSGLLGSLKTSPTPPSSFSGRAHALLGTLFRR